MPGDDRALAGRTFLVVLAHPDDESLACGGTIARLADAGAKVVLLCASRGERGSVWDQALISGRPLGEVRAAELDVAARVLGISTVILLNHRDAFLRWERMPELHAEILHAVVDNQPDGVITFGEDGLYWHQDHIGIHERTTEALESLGPDAPPLYYVTMPKGVMREAVETAVANGWAPAGASYWGIPPDSFGIAAMPPDFVVNVTAWADRKLAALQAHKTQIGPTHPFSHLSHDQACRWLGLELFRRAPIPNRGGAWLEIIGEPVPEEVLTRLLAKTPPAEQPRQS